MLCLIPVMHIYRSVLSRQTIRNLGGGLGYLAVTGYTCDTDADERARWLINSQKTAMNIKWAKYAKWIKYGHKSTYWYMLSCSACKGQENLGAQPKTVEGLIGESMVSQKKYITILKLTIYSMSMTFPTYPFLFEVNAFWWTRCTYMCL